MNSKLVGALGEQAVARYLRKNGYRIAAANFKTSTGEIDIIAEQGNTVCFVEVKTRKIGGMTSPRDAVDNDKINNIKSTAAAYISINKIKNNIRYDIAEVLTDPDNRIESINYIENAF